jgi:hypothetical protein
MEIVCFELIEYFELYEIRYELFGSNNTCDGYRIKLWSLVANEKV